MARRPHRRAGGSAIISGTHRCRRGVVPTVPADSLTTDRARDGRRRRRGRSPPGQAQIAGRGRRRHGAGRGRDRHRDGRRRAVAGRQRGQRLHRPGRRRRGPHGHQHLQHRRQAGPDRRHRDHLAADRRGAGLGVAAAAHGSARSASPPSACSASSRGPRRPGLDRPGRRRRRSLAVAGRLGHPLGPAAGGRHRSPDPHHRPGSGRAARPPDRSRTRRAGPSSATPARPGAFAVVAGTAGARSLRGRSTVVDDARAQIQLPAPTNPAVPPSAPAAMQGPGRGVVPGRRPHALHRPGRRLLPDRHRPHRAAGRTSTPGR